MIARSSPSRQDTQQDRAFLQARVATFWKAMFFILLFGSVLGVLGAVARPSGDVPLTIAATVDAGIVWWLCSRRDRSVRFCRLAEAIGLFVISLISAGIGRFLLASFASDRGITSAEGLATADGYVSMMQIAGNAMLMAIRAALIPSRPLRTVGLTLMFAAPMIVGSALVVPVAEGGLAWRPPDSLAYPWMPTNAAIMWLFAIIASTVISSVIYGLRTEVREVRRLGQYVLEQKLGQGGMGEVYRARHGMMRRPSAVKLIRADRAGETQIQRFEREVQLTARLTHPNTITIFDYGRTDDGVFYYAMELLDGATLQHIIAADGPQPAGRVVRILTMLCGALAEAHGIGLIHRDIKPANIMLCKQGGEHDVVKLLDFGLVKEAEVIETEVNLTGANMIVGTPKYMAPESLLDAGRADARSDIYALGAVAYYLLAGGDVFTGKSVLELSMQHINQEPQPLVTRGVQVPAELERVVRACLNKDPNQRPQSAGELRRQLEACDITAWDSDRAAAWWAHYQSATAKQPDAAAEAASLVLDPVR